jgi:uncharacterized membrane protein
MQNSLSRRLTHLDGNARRSAPPSRHATTKNAFLVSSALATFLMAPSAQACPNCATSRTVWSEIMAHDPLALIGILTFSFCVVAGLIFLSARLMHHSRPLFGGALLMGAGLGALFDGIVLHQVLQWHAMMSNWVTPIDLVSAKVNMFWDGVFHLYAWVATAVAIAFVVKHVPRAPPSRRGKTVTGGTLGGWGFFNLVEGVVDHHVFQLHHVHPGAGQEIWDAVFLLSGLLLVTMGFGLAVPVLREKSLL